MDLHSPKNRILLKNCIVVKRHELKLAEDTPEIQDELSYYFNLYQILKSDDMENLMATLKDSTLKEKYIAFNHHILSASSTDIAEEYMTLTESLMRKNNAYSLADFNNLKKAFYKGNEDLIHSDKTKNSYELEEETEKNSSQDYLSQNEKKYLNAIGNLFRKYPSQTMSAEQFKEFSVQFRDFTMALSRSKFEQTFAKEHKKIIDMHIFYEQSEISKPIYRTEFMLLDAQNTQTQQSICESSLKSTAYQALCSSYLEANTAVEIEQSSLNSDVIALKMKQFSKCYDKLKELMPTCFFKVENHALFYVGESDIAPSQELSLACDSPSQEEEEISI